MEKICKNCKYWEIIDNELDTEFKTGRCVSPHVIDGTHLVKRDGIGYSGNDLEFAEDYGCIHFEPKNDVDEVYNRLIKNLVELSQFAKAVENLPDIEMHSICELFMTVIGVMNAQFIKYGRKNTDGVSTKKSAGLISRNLS